MCRHRRRRLVVGRVVVTAPGPDRRSALAEPAADTACPRPVARARRRGRPSGAPAAVAAQHRPLGPGMDRRPRRAHRWLVDRLVSSWARRVSPTRSTPPCCGPSPGSAPSWLTPIARGVDRVATGWTMFFVAIALLVSTIVFNRWRHLFAFLGSVVVLQFIGLSLIAASRRPRPYDVTTIGRWHGYSSCRRRRRRSSRSPSSAVIYMLVVPGRPRAIAKRVGIVVVAVVAARAAVPRGRPSLRRARRRGPRCRHPADRLPLLHPQRGVPGHLPTGQDGAPRRRRPPRRGPAARRRGSARRHRRRREARSGSPVPAARRRCASVSPATPTPSCSGSSTR